MGFGWSSIIHALVYMWRGRFPRLGVVSPLRRFDDSNGDRGVSGFPPEENRAAVPGIRRPGVVTLAAALAMLFEPEDRRNSLRVVQS